MEDPLSINISDTSVLINFLATNRMDLIKRHSCRFLITNHVRHEVTEHYEEQLTRLQQAPEFDPSGAGLGKSKTASSSTMKGQ